MKKIYFDIGANRGIFCLNWCKDENKIVYAFEPNKELYNLLLLESKKYSNLFVYNNAIDNSSEEKNFYLSNDDACSSLLEFDKENIKKWSAEHKLYTIGIEKITTIKLSDFIRSNFINEIEYIKIDTQGNDLNVLKSLENEIIKVKRITVEVFTEKGYDSCYVNECKEYDVMEYMLSKGFQLEKKVLGSIPKFADLTFINKLK